MTSGAPDTPSQAPASTAFEVVTVTSDPLRANLCVTGVLAAATVPVLTTALHTHLRTGRRFLRVELSAATIADAAVVTTLAALHAETIEAGGVLVFAGAGPDDAATLTDGGLYLSNPS